jgi:signal transduction histidine kinase
MKYFSQFFIFIALIIVMALFVWRLYLALEKSRVWGKQRAAFSRQMVFAQEQERARIARELHDSVAQELSVLGMQVSQISRACGPDTAADIAGILTAILPTALNGVFRHPG